MARRKKRSEGGGAPPAEVDHFLTVVYDSAQCRPPHTVTVRSSVSGWEDEPMTCLETDDHAIWSATLQAKPDQGPTAVEFKLVLDGEHWMAGQNQTGRLATPAEVIHFDDDTVAWEM
jgi:hypothetical protein